MRHDPGSRRAGGIAVVVVTILLLGLGWVIGVSMTRGRRAVEAVEVRCTEVATAVAPRCMPPARVRRVLGKWPSGAVASLVRDDFGSWRLEAASSLEVRFPWDWEEFPQ